MMTLSCSLTEISPSIWSDWWWPCLALWQKYHLVFPLCRPPSSVDSVTECSPTVQTKFVSKWLSFIFWSCLLCTWIWSALYTELDIKTRKGRKKEKDNLSKCWVLCFFFSFLKTSCWWSSSPKWTSWKYSYQHWNTHQQRDEGSAFGSC